MKRLSSGYYSLLEKHGAVTCASLHDGHLHKVLLCIAWMLCCSGCSGM